MAVRGGGGNAGFLLGPVPAPGGHVRISAIARDTDGIDGTEANARSMVLPGAPARALAAGIDLRARLTENVAHSVFAAPGDPVVTGPTRANVDDFRAILVEPIEGLP